MVRIGEHYASSNGAGGRIELVIDEVDVTGVREALFISQSDSNWVLGANSRTRMRALLKAQIALLVTVEVDIDWINRDHRGQYGLIRLGEIARGQLRPADPAVNRRADFG